MAVCFHFLLPFLAMMLWALIVAVTFTFRSVRHAIDTPRRPWTGSGLIGAMVALLAVMVIIMLGNFPQIVLWAALFVVLVMFQLFYEEVYHSGVNFTSLGHGDVAMSSERKLLGSLKALNGILTLGLSSAPLVAILQHLPGRHVDGRNPAAWEGGQAVGNDRECRPGVLPDTRGKAG
ncbi:two pore domain potassium channel family protein [Accumulibacter sp.]|uniref:two pore domain potassium channel family protein n=1 Tax=Accumulibacter sp. TaxID=2053492 RepID=UPI0025DA9AD3|nr:two pore domain potassium channel family protein [Accumulibacter sp.]MCM8613893.1 two pore domain potassium channel family protein [Accumulibacter sp.]MCM8637720.1 two pore domain potassium channel family protein [Accumulibacter sp.]MCM8641066.1 two pore domain potassium channel family protein [Accumulibacter sp.]